MDDRCADWAGGLSVEDSGCRYILDSGKACDAPRKVGSSSYCPEHHALCHLTPEKARQRIIEIEALAKVVGGRLAARKIFSERELKRIERRAKNACR